MSQPNSEDIVVAYEDQRDTRASGMKGLDLVEISLKNLHCQDLSISYAQSDSEEDDVDKYSVGTPSPARQHHERKITRIVTTKNVGEHIIQLGRLRLTKTDDAGKSA